jgi:poly-gamma-glutamate synthase PgsB/CapB
MNTSEKINSLFSSGLMDWERNVYYGLISQLSSDFISRNPPGEISETTPVDREVTESLLDFLGWEIKKRLDKIYYLKNLRTEFDVRISKASSEYEKTEHILSLARALGSSGRNIVKDTKAFKRWFAYDAVRERLQKQVCDCEYQICFILERIGHIVSTVMAQENRQHGLRGTFWRKLKFDETFGLLMVYQGDSRIRIKAYACLSKIVTVMSSLTESNLLDPQSLRFIYRSSLESSENLWVRVEALKSLRLLDLHGYKTAVKQIFDQPLGGDHIFLRRAALSLEAATADSVEDLMEIIGVAENDPSPYVRQGLVSLMAMKCNGSPAHDERLRLLDKLTTFAKQDVAPEVRSWAVNGIGSLISLTDCIKPVSEFFIEHFTKEKDSFVLLVGLETISRTVKRLSKEEYHSESYSLYSSVLQTIEDLHRNCPDLSVRRRAAMAREIMFVAVDSKARVLKGILFTRLENIGMGQSVFIHRSELLEVNEELLGRVLSVMSQDNFDLNVTSSSRWVRITKGEVFGFRLWRLIHELRNPMPDKRQGFSHTIGRTSRDRLRAPSNICCELTETRVPGEPLYMQSEAGWRPYLPLVDHVASVCRSPLASRPLKLYTAEGVTEVAPPRSLLKRIFAFVKLTFGFPHYAHLRNWSEAGGSKPGSYVEALNAIGVKCQFNAHKEGQKKPFNDAAVMRFFSSFLGIDLSGLWPRFRDYFFSAYENSLYQLGVFSAALLAFFASRILYVRWSIKRARKSFALCIGGWGTRGKSGVERLKTALFEALGHGLMAKTTGCEAMFLHAYPFGRTREMFVYRPYDKATIWEHHDMMLLANKLRSKIFLWECMGLNPSFVKILQRQWSVDDYSTITNAYPDHEDIQGPAGINIPEAMGSFVPRKSVLVTSEKEMEPILRSAADKLGTRFVPADWKEAGMLTKDVLDRFPYEEHPNNIALVLALVKELGIDPDFALKEMADRVVPDIGVLKVFPVANVSGRHLEFVNGMSANERYATLSNWVRMGFDDIDAPEKQGIIISTVVNNRADRLSRSRMFASILVNDLSADYHFLIGSNLAGLKQFIMDEWEIFIKSVVSGSSTTGNSSMSESSLFELARRLRIPTTQEDVLMRLNSILSGLRVGKDIEPFSDVSLDRESIRERLLNSETEIYSDDIERYIAKQIDLLSEFQEIHGEISQASLRQDSELSDKVRTIATKWFMDKFVIIEDYHTPGDQIIDTICAHTPPGLLNRIMGLQNIKGTGLDFVYRWQSWEICYSACQKLLDKRGEEIFEQGLKELVAFNDYSLLCEYTVRETLATVKLFPVAQKERVQALLSMIESSMNATLNGIREHIGVSSMKKGLLTRLAESIEALFDVADSVIRRRTARKIYKDLVTERISHERAALELKKLNRRQAGG